MNSFSLSSCSKYELLADLQNIMLSKRDLFSMGHPALYMNFQRCLSLRNFRSGAISGAILTLDFGVEKFGISGFLS